MMNKKVLTACFSLILSAPTIGFSQSNQFEYFDCWMENINRIDLGEQIRLNIEPKKFAGSTWLCGCYTVREKGGFGFTPEILCMKNGFDASYSGMALICLDALTELGLLIRDGEFYTVNKNSGKADLTDSLFLQALGYRQ